MALHECCIALYSSFNYNSHHILYAPRRNERMKPWRSSGSSSSSLPVASSGYSRPKISKNYLGIRSITIVTIE